MKLLLLVFAFVTSTVGMSSDVRTATCKGQIPGIESVLLTASLDEKGLKKSSYIFKPLQEGQVEIWENAEVNPAETDELFIGYGARFNYFFAHHNTLLSVSADGDIFGYANENENADQYSGFRGKLVLWTGAGDQAVRKIFDVVCVIKD